MVSIIKDIIDVAKALFGLKESMLKAEQQKRDEMADYFKAVSVCLADTYEKLSDNVVPHGRCAELYRYSEQLPDVVKKYIPDDKAQELARLLMDSHKVEGLYSVFEINPESKKELPKIAEASGIFLALSNSVRAGYKPND